MARKSGTDSEKRKYRYLSFRDRAAKTKIDAVRRIKRPFVADSNESSFFRSAYDHWIQVNISGSFRDFAHEVQYISETLPQILHHRNRILDLILEHISRHDQYSMEPLLDLLSNFAHDLGSDFEPFFPRAFGVLKESLETDVLEVIEAVFNCIAFLFKYLSRLLTSDLRPTFELISSLLGKDKTSESKSRFAAEAFAFLIRRCDNQGLDVILPHILLESQEASSTVFDKAIIIIITEALKNTDTELHSKAQLLFSGLLRHGASKDSSEHSLQITCSVMIKILIQVDSKSAATLSTEVLNHISQMDLSDSYSIFASSRLIIVLCSTDPNNNELLQWNDIMGKSIDILVAVKNHSLKDNELALELPSLVSVVFKYCDMRVLANHHSSLLGALLDIDDGSPFLSFCDYAIFADSARFGLALPVFNQFVSIKALQVEESFHTLAWKVQSRYKSKHLHTWPFPNNVVTIGSGSPLYEAFESQVQSWLSGPFTASQDEQNLLFMRLNTLQIFHTGFDSIRAQLVELLDLLSNSQTGVSIIGKILEVISSPSKVEKVTLNKCLTHVISRASFLSNQALLLGVEKSLGTLSPVSDSLFEALINQMGELLLSGSSQCRKQALNIFMATYCNRHIEIPAIVNHCHTITSLGLEVSEMRNIAMHIRRIGIDHTLTASTQSAEFAIRYLFGTLLTKFSPIWDVCIETLVSLAKDHSQLVWNYCLRLLSKADGSASREDAEEDELRDDILPDHTLDLRLCESKILQRNIERFIEAWRDVKCSHREINRIVNDQWAITSIPDFARTQAFRLMVKLPRLAEQHSRDIVPYILFNKSEANGTDLEDVPQSWSRKDLLELLNVFSKFVNPSVLYKSQDVYERLLELITNQDIELQRRALNCIFTWKRPTLKAYEDNLRNLLDESRLKDELVLLIPQSGDLALIKPEDRQEVFDIVIRLLFGRSLKKKTSGLRQSQKNAVFSALESFDTEHISQFVDLAISPLNISGFFNAFNDNVSLPTEMTIDRTIIRRQSGFVNALQDLTRHLGSSLSSSGNKIVRSLLYCLVSCQEAIASGCLSEDLSAAARNIRQNATKCLGDLMNCLEPFDWSLYQSIIFDRVLHPRLEKFAEENLQQPSAIMKIFLIWSSKPNFVIFLLQDNLAIIYAISELLKNEKASDSVINYVFDFVAEILNLDVDSNEQLIPAQEEILLSIIPTVLERSPALFESITNRETLAKQVRLLVDIPKKFSIQDSALVNRILLVGVSALEKPGNKIPANIKLEILKAISSLYPSSSLTDTEFEACYKSLSRLFMILKDREPREFLSDIFCRFSSGRADLVEPLGFVNSLNSYSKSRLGEPDFERRLKAFGELNDTKYLSFTTFQWIPLVYSFLHFIRDTEELSLRTNATFSLQRFIDAAVSRNISESGKDFQNVIKDIILPAVKIGVRESNEIIRLEYVNVLAHVVRKDDLLPEMLDMKTLLFEGDEEANFFNNILHIQQHRKIRAVRRLGQISAEKKISDYNLAHYLLPLIEHFVVAKDSEAQSLSAESVTAIGLLARSLSWNQYRAIVKRYVSTLTKEPQNLRVTIRLLNAIADATQVLPNEESHSTVEFCSQEKLNSFIMDDILPQLRKILQRHDKDDENSEDRIPLAIPAVKFIKLLSQEVMELELPRILTGLCQILRSRSQSIRDAIRVTLSKIAQTLGPHYLVFIIKELKGALRRGYQLHVCGYTLHSLLVDIGPLLKHGDLDSVSTTVMDSVMEDIFGVTGAEKDAEDYISKMREVKQNKSYDTAEILTRNINLSQFHSILSPIKALLLHTKLTSSIGRKVNELFRRIGLGLQRNEEFTASEASLVFCYSLYQEGLPEKNVELNKRKDISETEKRHTIQLNARGGEARDIYVTNLSPLVRLSLDSLRSVLSRRSELMTEKNLAGFIPLMKRGLKDPHEDIQISALRILTTVLPLDIEELNASSPLLADQAMKFIKDSPKTNSELCQASFKFFAVLIRLKKSFVLKDSVVAYLLERMKTDIEEPDRQGVMFSFIRAVISRKIMAPEVYSTVDRLAEIMITNQSTNVRSTCRSIYCQFILEYPQGKKRLQKTLSFLVQNLEYPSESGRLSVLEVINFILDKVGDEFLSDALVTFFAALVLVLVNDESSRCKELSSVLIGKILKRFDDTKLKTIIDLCTNWLEQNDKPGLVRGSLQVFGIYVDTRGIKDTGLVKRIVSKIEQVLALASIKNADSDDELIDWQSVYFSLQLWARLIRNGLDASVEEFFPIWDSVISTLLFPHPWVRLSASRCVGLLLSDVDKGSLPAFVDGEKYRQIAFRLVRQLGALGVSETLGVQTTKNIIFIARHYIDTEEETYRISEAEIKVISSDGGTIEAVNETSSSSEMAIFWLVNRVISVLKDDRSPKEMLVSKRSAIQILAAISQLASQELLAKELAELIIAPIYTLMDLPENSIEPEFKTLGQETLNLIQSRMSPHDYGQAYSKVRENVKERRLERKHKRAIQSISEPVKAAHKRMKKHQRTAVSKKRKHQKWES